MKRWNMNSEDLKDNVSIVSAGAVAVVEIIATTTIDRTGGVMATARAAELHRN
jgi:hypothetical protein